MSDALRLESDLRSEFGKGAARRLRREGKIPAVMYGHGSDPLHIALPGHESMLALKHANALLTIVIDGKEQLALAKDVQRDPIKPIIEHVDLVIVKKGEKVVVEVPIHIDGEAKSAVVTVESNTVEVEAEATHLPESITVSVDGLEAGTQILASNLTMPEGCALVTDGEQLVVNITAQISQEELEAELAGDGEPAEGETAEDAAAEGESEETESE